MVRAIVGIAILAALGAGLAGDNTKYPEDFTSTRIYSSRNSPSENARYYQQWLNESRYSDIKVGMSRDTVISILGKPGYSDADTTLENLVYSDHNIFEKDLRFVVTLRGGKVVKVGRRQVSDFRLSIDNE